jgi:NTE family protein
MKKFVRHTLSLLVAAASLSLTAPAQAQQRVGLVLSGGGARGIAHIGLIQALEDNNIPIDYVTGTSMGAIVGALYAMGYSPQEMLALIKSDEFHLWQTGKIDDRLVDYFRQQEHDPALLSVRTSFADSVKVSKFLPQSLINASPMNFAFLKLFSNATARTDGDFDRLFVPYRAVASDIYNKRPVIFAKGNLGDAVRSSMTFPFVFKPIEVNGMLLFDGGIYNNYPVDIMKQDFAPDFIIGSAVSENPSKPTEADLMGQIENMVMQKTNYDIDSIDGISIQFMRPDVSLLDFQKADELYKLGYDKGMEYIDRIKERVDRRVDKESVALNRIVYRSHDPEVAFDTVKISGVTPAQRRYLAKQFRHRDREKLTMDDAERAYFGLVSDSKVAEIMPSVEKNAAEGYNLRLRVKLNQDVETSIGGLITSMNSNRIYLGVGYRYISAIAGDCNVSGQLGKTYNTVRFDNRIFLPTDFPLALVVNYAFINQKYYENESLFATNDVPCFMSQNENHVLLGLALPLGLVGKATYGAGYASMTDRYYQSRTVDFSSVDADRNRYSLFKAFANFDINRITARDYPLEGFRNRLRLAFLTGRDTYLPAEGTGGRTRNHISWLQAKYQNETYLKVGRKVVLGVGGEVVASTKTRGFNYTATLLQAPVFQPTPHSQITFNEAYRAYNYAAIALKPIWKVSDLFHVRSEFYAFQPARAIEAGADNRAVFAPFKFKPKYISEVSAVLKFSFISVAAFVNYYSAPRSDWNFGLNLGCLLNTPRFID